MEEYHSGSTIQEFSLLRIRNFSSPQIEYMPSPHVVYLGSLYGIQEQNLLVIKVHFQLSSVQFPCPGPVSVSWISAVPGNASVVLLAPPPRGEESVFNQIITTGSGQDLLLILNLAKGKKTPLSIIHSSCSRAKPGNPVQHIQNGMSQLCWLSELLMRAN